MLSEALPASELSNRFEKSAPAAATEESASSNLDVDAYRYVGNERLKQEAEKKNVPSESDGDGLTSTVAELSNADPPAAAAPATPAIHENRPEVAARKAGAPADAPVATEAKELPSIEADFAQNEVRGISTASVSEAAPQTEPALTQSSDTYYAEVAAAPQNASAPVPVEQREQMVALGYGVDATGPGDGVSSNGLLRGGGGGFGGGGLAPGVPRRSLLAGVPEAERQNWAWQDRVSTNESYGEIVENTFKQVRQEPLSTFSIDVDTAGYSNVRRMLQDGQRPPRDAVRIEELVNYFKYSYPEPQGEHPLGAYAQIGPCPWNPQHQLAQVAMKAKALPKDANIRANLVFLIDVSGSMDEPNKLPLVRESLLGLVRALQGNHRIGIVTYAGSSGVALPSTSDF